MNILFVNRFAEGEQVPTARMLRDVAHLLAKLGHQVTVLATHAGYGGVHNAASDSINKAIALDGSEENGALKIAKTITLDAETNIADGVGGVRIKRVWTPAARMPAWLVFLIQVFVRLPFMRWDVCVLMTDPPFMTPVARITRLFGGARHKIFWWTMDLYPESLSAAGMISEAGVLFRFLAWLNRFGAAGLTGIICLGERQRERLTLCVDSMPTANIVCVPPWDYRAIPKIPRDQNKFLRSLCRVRNDSVSFAPPDTDRKIALYAGNLGQGHSFIDLVNAARIMAKEPDNPWLFVFVCRGALRAKLEQAAAGLSNVIIMDYLPADQTPELLWSASVHLITMADGWDGVVVPSKLYGVLQTDAPILFIGPERADTALEIRRMNRGLCLLNGCGGTQVIDALEKLDH